MEKISQIEKINYIISSAKLNINKNEVLKSIEETSENKQMIELIYAKIQKIENEKIFVSIASYRDENTYDTIKDLIKKAENPDLLSIFCLYQGKEEDPVYINLKNLEKDNSNLKIGFIHYKKSEGVCWARSNILKNISDEYFFFQIDSHMIFTGHWDTKLKKDYIACNSKKALLSGHPAPYAAPSSKFAQRSLLDYSISTMQATTNNRFSPSSIYNSENVYIDWNKIKNGSPVKHYFVSAGYFFGPSLFFKEVPYDPYLYFGGEEIDLSIRLFTYGWDLYAPPDCYVWHLYLKESENKKIHWDDYNLYLTRDQITKDRLYKKFSILKSDPAHIKSFENIEKFSIGTKRTIEEWQRCAKIDLINMKVIKEESVI